MRLARLEQYGLLRVAGEDARAFLHAQLTNDVENLAPGTARYAGWCSAKGRLMATFLVVPQDDGFLLQLSRDLAPAVAKRLAMFVLRSKVKISDVSGELLQYGLWEGLPGGVLSVRHTEDRVEVAIDAKRTLLITKAAQSADAAAEDWALEEIRAGRPLIMQATQDQFVPQMVNLELAGGVDFRKGCYPGQEIVARAQYRGAVKRRMVRLRGARLQPGQEIHGEDAPGQAGGAVGTVVNSAGGESLAVLQVATIEAKAPVRAQPQAAALEVLPLPYAQ